MFGGEGMDEIRRSALTRELGLDQPVFVQYGKCLWEAPRGDLGNSCRAGMPRASAHQPTPAGYPPAFLLCPFSFAFDRSSPGSACGHQAQFRRHIASFICGPGTLPQAYSVDEWVAIADLQAALAGYAAIARRVMARTNISG